MDNKEVENKVEEPINETQSSSIGALQATSYGMFIILLVLYEIIIIYTDFNKHIVAGCLFSIYIGVQYFLNYAISKKVNPGGHVIKAVKGILPGVLMLLPMYGLINVFPHWLEVFSNTFGLLYIKFRGIDKLLNGTEEKPGLLFMDKESRLANAIYGNNVNWLNQFRQSQTYNIESYYYEIERLFKENIFNSEILSGKIGIENIKSNPDTKKFAELMIQKYKISEFLWLLLIGLGFSVSTTILMMVN